MEDTILELVEICQHKELLCIRDNVDDLIESALNSKLLSINSQHLDNKEQEFKNVLELPAERGNRSIESLQNFRVIHKNSISFKNSSQISPVHAVAPILSTKEPEYSTSMGYEHPNTTPKTESNEIIKSESDKSLSDNFSPEFKTFCDHTEETRSGNTTTHANDSLPEYDLFCFEIEPDQERLINVLKSDISNDSSNDSLLEEANLFLASDNSIPPGIENFADDSERDIRFLEELLIDDSIPINESPDSDLDNSSFPRPPPEPPDAEPDSEEEIPVVMNVIDKLECFNPKDEFDDDDYSSLMFVIYTKMFLSFRSAECEDTIFDPSILV
nr:hypothetical protein [Tanacetum cinerariifolium]